MQNIIRPKALKKGGNIALIAPAGPINELQLNKAVQNIKKLGYNPVYNNNILSRKGYLAGEDEQRVQYLQDSFTDNNIDAILCIRGGYGCARIIDKIDFDIIKNNPKIFIGYSDITVLLNTFWKKTGLITFHGIVGTSAFNDYTIHQFHNTFSHYLSNNEIKSNIKTKEINKGKAQGRLVGGNLAIINSLLGTKFEIDFSNKIVFLEDVGEPPYKIDRMLTQLLLTGNLHKASGIVLGQFHNCDINNVDITKEISLSLNEVFYDRLKHMNIPIMEGFSFGHIQSQAIFPVGLNVEIDTNKSSLKVLEEAFSSIS